MTRRTRPAPGQLTLDAALLTVILPTGRALVLLQGGVVRTPEPTPITTALAVAQRRRAA
jgi:hypothetical protein